MRHAIVEDKTRIVVNLVIWEGVEWKPPRNHIVVRTDVGEIGDIYHLDKNVFERPPQVLEEAKE